MKFPLNTRRKYGGCFTGIQWNYRRRRWNPFWCPKRHRIRFYRWRKMKVPAAAVKWSGRVCGRSTSATGCSTCGRSGWGSSGGLRPTWAGWLSSWRHFWTERCPNRAKCRRSFFSLSAYLVQFISFIMHFVHQSVANNFKHIEFFIVDYWNFRVKYRQLNWSEVANKLKQVRFSNNSIDFIVYLFEFVGQTAMNRTNQKKLTAH